jgi:hypothetical protein
MPVLRCRFSQAAIVAADARMSAGLGYAQWARMPFCRCGHDPFLLRLTLGKRSGRRENLQRYQRYFKIARR